MGRCTYCCGAETEPALWTSAWRRFKRSHQCCCPRLGTTQRMPTTAALSDPPWCPQQTRALPRWSPTVGWHIKFGNTQWDFINYREKWYHVYVDIHVHMLHTWNRDCVRRNRSKEGRTREGSRENTPPPPHFLSYAESRLNHKQTHSRREAR